MRGVFLRLEYKNAKDLFHFAIGRMSRHNGYTIEEATTRLQLLRRMTATNTKNENVNTHITETATQSGTETESVTVSDKRHVETETAKQRLETNIFVTIQCANALMSWRGNDAACLGLDELRWASDADIALQDDYEGMMRYLYEYDDGSGYHPYFCQPVEYYTSGEHF